MTFMSLVGAFSVITNLRMELFEALTSTQYRTCLNHGLGGTAAAGLWQTTLLIRANNVLTFPQPLPSAPTNGGIKLRHAALHLHCGPPAILTLTLGSNKAAAVKNNMKMNNIVKGCIAVATVRLAALDSTLVLVCSKFRPTLSCWKQV